MTAATALVPAAAIQPKRGPWIAAHDAFAVTNRNLIALRRVPQLLVFSTIQPVIFVLLFRYALGGAIQVPGVPYVDYLMPGIFAQTVVFGAMGTAVGLATDLQTGIIERFRSLPMARSAVLVGRTTADLARDAFVVVLMVVVGFAVGFNYYTNLAAFLASLLLVLLFGYVMAWIFAVVGLAVGDPEAAQAAAFPIMAPLVFASSAFVPISSMPGWLQDFANHQPLTATVNAARALVLGGPTTEFVVRALAWDIGLLALAAPLAVWWYRRVT
ncbi:MAG: ABC transporter permease [Acidimicrobiia bacterium]